MWYVPATLSGKEKKYIKITHSHFKNPNELSTTKRRKIGIIVLDPSEIYIDFSNVFFVYSFIKITFLYFF